MHTPDEAIAELEFATAELGLKAFMFGGPVLRPYPGQDPSTRLARWVDTLGPDSPYDYDPVWQRCIELGVAPTFHSAATGWGSRTSTTSYVWNHIGMFATAGEAMARSLFLAGVPHRFPELRFAFLEGGVAWAASLYADLLGHWEKRNRDAVELYNPDHLDRARLVELFEQFGDDRYRARLDQLDDGLTFLSLPDEDPDTLDEFAACGIERGEDIRDVFTRQFHFGCEADDPLTALAFDTARNPLGARFKALFASDIGHWDVPDVGEVLPEAWELVEHGHATEADFRSLTFENPISLWAGHEPRRSSTARPSRRPSRRSSGGSRSSHAVAPPRPGSCRLTRCRSAAARGRSRPRSSGTNRRSRGRGGAGSPPSSGSRSRPR